MAKHKGFYTVEQEQEVFRIGAPVGLFYIVPSSEEGQGFPSNFRFKKPELLPKNVPTQYVKAIRCYSC